MTAALTTGLGLGFLVAAQVGPVWLLCVRSVLRGRVAAGLAIGAAAALVDTAYAASLLVGIGIGSFTWFAILSVVSGMAGARLGERVQRPIDVISGLALACFGGYLGFATLRDS